MVRELAVLGFVSFTATVIQQFVQLSEETKETFEYSHVLMFVTAIFYAVEISVISRMLDFVVQACEGEERERVPGDVELDVAARRAGAGLGAAH
eukprot:2400046-Prymnesium_polylepis.1